MRRVDFDYGITCPKIDREIRNAQDLIDSFLMKLINDLCPMMTEARKEEIAKERCDDLYSDLEDIFEETRKTNEDMRKSAERQIGDLIDELASVKHDLERLELNTGEQA